MFYFPCVLFLFLKIFLIICFLVKKKESGCPAFGAAKPDIKVHIGR